MWDLFFVFNLYLSTMNFLGHLYFSNNDHELMYANLFGDHVKGRDMQSYSKIVRSGIQLHRSIDDYIDHHPVVVELMHQLYSELPKVTGIAIDLFFDHLLAKHWNKFHSVPYQDFLEKFYQYKPKYWSEYTPDFQNFVHTLRENRWLDYYPEMYGLQKSCEGVSSRLSFENQLKNAPTSFIKHEQEIQTCFEFYMTEAIPYFHEKRHLLGL